MKATETPKPEQWKESLEEFQAESDRGCALLGAAFLDEQLRVLLEAFLVDDPKRIGKLLSGFGPLATFEARTSLAYALGFLSDEERRDLDLLRKVRNDFAHNLHGVSFRSPEVEDRCKELASCNIGLLPGGADHARNRFTLAVVQLASIVALRRLSIRGERRVVHRGMRHAETLRT